MTPGIAELGQGGEGRYFAGLAHRSIRQAKQEQAALWSTAHSQRRGCGAGAGGCRRGGRRSSKGTGIRRLLQGGATWRASGGAWGLHHARPCLGRASRAGSPAAAPGGRAPGRSAAGGGAGSLGRWLAHGPAYRRAGSGSHGSRGARLGRLCSGGLEAARRAELSAAVARAGVAHHVELGLAWGAALALVEGDPLGGLAGVAAHRGPVLAVQRGSGVKPQMQKNQMATW